MPNVLSENRLLTPADLLVITGYAFNNYLQNPDTVIRKLSVQDQWKFYQEIEADDMVSTCMNKVVRGVTALKWEIYQGDADDNVYEIVKSNFDHLNRSGYIRNTNKNIVKTLNYGRQFIEVDWEFINGSWQVYKLDTLPLELFFYDADGEVALRNAQAYVFKDVPEFKVINPRNNSTMRNPYGESILSKCYWSVFFKKNALQFMNSYLERDGMPWIIGEYDESVLSAMFPDLSPEDAVEQITELIKSKTGDAILTLPKEIAVRVENAGSVGTNASNYKMMIDLCNEAISRIWTGHTATTIATPGKLGNDESATVGLVDVIDDAKEIVVESMNQLIGWIGQVNFSNTIELPQFRFYEEKDINQELAVRDKGLYDMGIRPTKAYISREYSIPEDEFEIIEASQNTIADPVIKAFMTPVIDEIKNGLVIDADVLRSKVASRAGNYSDVQIDYIMNKCLEWAQ